MKSLVVMLTAVVVAPLATVAYLGQGKQKVVSYPHDKAIDTYQNTVRSFLLEQPKDGKFSDARVPNIHALFAQHLPGYKDIKDLSKDYRIYSFLIGSPGNHRPSGVGRTPVTLPSEIVRCYLRIYHEKDIEDPVEGGLFLGQSRHPTDTAEEKAELKKIGDEIVPMAKDTRALCESKGYENYSSAVKVAGKQAWVAAKPITPKDNSCYNCHTGVKTGQPIGHVITFLIKKSNK